MSRNQSYKLSIICPGIRPQNWVSLYTSIEEATKESWEIIFVGPYDLSDELKDKDNVTYIKDFGSPVRCKQIGVIHSKGKYINWASDDGLFLPNSIDNAFKLLEPNSIVMQKYYEGSHNQIFEDDKYYKLAYHDSTSAKYIPEDYWILNGGLIPLDIALELGGWDAELFEVWPMALADFAVRVQKFGIKLIMQEDVAFSCTHEPGITGTHAPIHYAQITHDEPVFKQLYNSPESVDRIKIDINNWKRSPERWVRRFGKQGDIA